MRALRNCLLLAGSVLVLGGLAIFARYYQERGPRYRGQSLTSWVIARGYSFRNPEADDAIRQVGTNALPFLLDWIQFTPNRGEEQRFLTWNKRLRNLRINFGLGGDWSMRDTKSARAIGAEKAFEALGPAAAGAVPELTRILNESPPSDVQRRAARALAAIGPSGLPALRSALHSLRPDVRAQAAFNIQFVQSAIEQINSAP